ncbi:hypothetical protein ENSA7_62980 [Enhygromyxa salina]|uniref:Uncharacterized protein n=1 Tax=Enhygromyxa salina TaxID=215803 RepID=A0A2S9Y3I4_9BACT|nr:hypothetical protein ENSA7_62980 [Enhygromyxa salina]
MPALAFEPGDRTSNVDVLIDEFAAHDEPLYDWRLHAGEEPRPS